MRENRDFVGIVEAEPGLSCFAWFTWFFHALWFDMFWGFLGTGRVSHVLGLFGALFRGAEKT